MPGKVGHELALAVDLPNMVYAPLAAGEFQASRNLKGRDTHSRPQNPDGVVECAQLNVVCEHAEAGEDALGRLPIILSLSNLSNFSNFSDSGTQAADPL